MQAGGRGRGANDVKQKPEEFIQAVERGVRKEAKGKLHDLQKLLKHWRNTQSFDDVKSLLKPDSLRFLARYGALDAGKDSDALLNDFQDFLTGISRASGSAPGIVAGWIELFAAGAYAVLGSGICAPEPRCGICPLKETCRYLAAGAKDARSFGQILARGLLLDPVYDTVDLSAAELLAFVLAGEKSGSADIARGEALLKALNGLRGVFQAKPDMLRELGMNDAAIARLQATAELCRMWAAERVARGNAFTCGKDFYDFFHLRLRELEKEVFIVVLLDQKNRLIDHRLISEGSLTETLAHPREVFAEAIQRRAAAIAVIHNHPSGDPAPSNADKMITKRLNGVAKLVGIRLLDHVVIGDGRFFSFVEESTLG